MKPGRKVGLYARVSTEDQDPEPQVARLKEWVEKQDLQLGGVWTDVASGRDADRPGQEQLMGEAMGRRVMVVAVVRIDRWARSVSQLAGSVDKLLERGVAFCAIDQGLELRSGDPTSRLVCSVLGAVAEWEASIISERTKDALEQKKKEGVKLGRPAKPCYVCGGDRTGANGAWAKVNGEPRAVCRACKRLDPAERRRRVEERGGA